MISADIIAVIKAFLKTNHIKHQIICNTDSSMDLLSDTD
jgi:hypothetical protein